MGKWQVSRRFDRKFIVYTRPWDSRAAPDSTEPVSAKLSAEPVFAEARSEPPSIPARWTALEMIPASRLSVSGVVAAEGIRLGGKHFQ